MLTITFGNHFKYHLANKDVNLASDTLKMALMASGYTFNKDTAHGWSDVSASEYADTAHGYTAGGATISTHTITESDANDRAEIDLSTVSWTATGADIGPTPGAIIYDDSEAGDVVVCYLDFGGNQTAASGTDLAVENVQLRVS